MEAIKHGWPVSVRAMSLEFPSDRTAWLCDQQFMLGSSILVAPVFDESGEVEFYLPTVSPPVVPCMPRGG
jgi:alpha-D-xyloside xylohydrolase